MDECNCPCHTYGDDINVNHFGPCCIACSVCKKNIKIDFHSLHVKDCKDIFQVNSQPDISGIKNETFDQMIRRKKDKYMRDLFE